jgi:hypothetical protein
MSRVNPLEDLSDFQPKQTTESHRKPVEPGIIDQLAEDNGFPSRQPTVGAPADSERKKRRRFTTGRNQQINIKATNETIEKLYAIADEMGLPLGEVLARALELLRQSRSR